MKFERLYIKKNDISTYQIFFMEKGEHFFQKLNFFIDRLKNYKYNCV